MHFPMFVGRRLGWLGVVLLPWLALADGENPGADFYEMQGGEYAVSGTLFGDQVYPDVSVSPTGGIVVWHDNATDGSGLGISAQRLDGSLSGSLSSFRVNQKGADDQNRPRVALLNDGGAVVVWQGGRQGFQNIYARFLSANNTWATGDRLVNTFTNHAKVTPAVAVLKNGNVVVVWGSFNQEGPNSLQGVYGQQFSPNGDKIGGEFLVNQTTAFNQRAPAVAALSDGRFAVAWVSEQQRFENSVDIYARFFTSAGSAASGEFILNSGTNLTGYPSLAPSPAGGFFAAWSERDLQVRSNGWDIVARPVTAAGVGGPVQRVNGLRYGDQIAPRISAVGDDYLAVWTSIGQDGSREGVYGRFLRADGAPAGTEFRVNTTTVSQQMHPAVASDGVDRCLVVWTSFVGGQGGFDLYAQRYASTTQPLLPPDAPFVSALSSNTLSVTWAALAGFDVANYEVYADGAASATAVTTNNFWTLSGLAANSTHYCRLAYVLADGRRSPLSEAATNTTYGSLWYHNLIPQEWMTAHFGTAFWAWPSPSDDSDGDGATNLQEFQAGTHPGNVNSVLRTRLQPTTQGFYLHWNTRPGQIYQVQAANDLGEWNNLGGLRFAAGHLDSIYLGLGSGGFYRVLRVR